MADIRGILKINDQGNGVIDSFTSNIYTNNISKYNNSNNILEYINSQTRDNDLYSGAIGTPIGTTTIGNLRFGVVSSGTRSETYNGMDFGYTNSNGVLNLTFTIVGTDVISFKMRFDSSRNQYPTNYTWVDKDGTTHNVSGNTSNELVFQQNAGYGTTTITFSQWNLANTMVGLTFIESVEIDVFLDKRHIISYESQTQTTTDVHTIQYGVLPNTGQIKLKDVNNELLEKAKMGYLNTRLFTLELYMNGRLFASHISTQSPYFDGDKTITLQLTNQLDNWNYVEIPEINVSSGTSLLNVFKQIMWAYDSELLESEIEAMLDGKVRINTGGGYHDTDTILFYLGFIYLSSCTIKKATMIEQINKICTIAQLQCYVNDNGDIKFKSARPLTLYRRTQYFNIYGIEVKEKDEISRLDYDILVSNRYEDVNIS